MAIYFPEMKAIFPFYHNGDLGFLNRIRGVMVGVVVS
jgi:hypothetical protein